MANKVYTAEDFMPQDEVLDTTATRTRQDILDPETEEAKGLWQESKAIAMETLPGLATGIATSPWLLAGPKGWVGYGLLNFATGFGSNTIAQKMRNPEKDTSFKEATLNGAFTAVPGIAPARTAKLGKKSLMAVRAGEAGFMGGGEELGRPGCRRIPAAPRPRPRAHRRRSRAARLGEQRLDRSRRRDERKRRQARRDRRTDRPLLRAAYGTSPAEADASEAAAQRSRLCTHGLRPGRRVPVHLRGTPQGADFG